MLMAGTGDDAGRLLLMGSSAYKAQELHPKVRERLDNAIDLGMTVIVGEAKGASRAFQDYLASKGYRNVVVGHARSIRYNAGEWVTRRYGDDLKERERKMIEDCDTAIIIWVNQSSVIAENLEMLKRQRKPTLLHEVDTQTGAERVGDLNPNRIYSRFYASARYYRKKKSEG
jgi:hypothetical protein